MVLIKSVSGIRGTINKISEENLNPFNVLKFITIYAFYLNKISSDPSVILGRAGRVSGPHISKIMSIRLHEMGVNVINIFNCYPNISLYVSFKKKQVVL